MKIRGKYYFPQLNQFPRYGKKNVFNILVRVVKWMLTFELVQKYYRCLITRHCLRAKGGCSKKMWEILISIVY